MLFKRSSASLKIAATLFVMLITGTAHAGSTRGMVVAMNPIPGSEHCELVIEDEYAKRTLYFLAYKSVCEQRAQWVGKTALFHLSLVDVGRNRLEAVATRVKEWPAKAS